MKQAIIMPKLGLSMTEGSITAWNVQVGDVIQEGDVVFSLETDKIVHDTEATAAGRVVEILYQVGDEVPVGEPCLYVETL